MANPIDFYFDFSSPYGYFASTKIDDLAARHGRSVVWRPILLGAVFKITGQQPLPTIPLKGSYAAHDLARSARLFKVPFKLPTKFPVGATAPSRAFYWVSDRDPALAKTARAGALPRLFRGGPRHLQPGGDRQGRRRSWAWTRASSRRRSTTRRQGAAADRGGCGDRARRVRLTLHRGGRRAVLGLGPARPGRALAGNWRMVR